MTRPNILLIVLDATRADACSCYTNGLFDKEYAGTAHPTTPNLDALASQGTLYEQAISPAPWTLPAFASLFTGRFPGQIGVYEQKRLSTSPPTLASLLSQQGYTTFGVTSNSWLSADFGLQRGFDHIHKLWQVFQTSRDINRLVLLNRADPEQSWVPQLFTHWMQGNPLKNVANTVYNRFWSYRRDYGASRTLRPLRQWLRRQSRRPWFALVHYLEAHLEYKPPTAWARRFAHDWDRVRYLLQQDQVRMAWRHIAGVEPLSEQDLMAWQDLYLAEVAYADHHMGQLLDDLRGRGELEHTMIVVVADHGENLGEHGLLNHQYCVYDTLLHVPLLVVYPPRFPAGQRIAQQVQTLDLFATILTAANVELPPGSSRDLLPPWGNPRPFVIAEYGPPRVPHATLLRRYGLRAEQLTRFARGLIALRTETHKLIVGTDGSVELYDWQQDPSETHDLSAQRPDLVNDLMVRLTEWREKHVTSSDPDENPPEIDADTLARLQALGYVA